MTRFLGYATVTLIIVLSGALVTAQLDLTTFTPDTPILSSEVNANFQALADAIESRGT